MTCCVKRLKHMQLKNNGYSLISKRAPLWGKIQCVWQNCGVQMTATLIYDLDLAVSFGTSNYAILAIPIMPTHNASAASVIKEEFLTVLPFKSQ